MTLILPVLLLPVVMGVSEAAARQTAARLPRMGNWLYPGRDQAKLKQLLALGVGFTSSYDLDPALGKSLFASGIVTNLCPNRPSGAELIAGLGLTSEDMDQDAQGRRTSEGIESAVFHSAVPDRFCEYLRQKIRPIAKEPWVASVLISSPISMYGEVHYAPSTAGQYAVFGRPAKANFRSWLKKTYGNDPAAVSKAWGQEIKSWESIDPPIGPKAGPARIDNRQCWSDFMHWYNWWLDEITWRSLQTARQETEKPIATMIGGPKVGFNQGISLGNVGPVVRMLGKLRPSFFSDTDAQTLFSTRYTRAACSQYGVELMQEHVGPPHLQVFHQYSMLLNLLSCGADYVHLATLGELFDQNHWFSRVWKDLSPVALRYHTSPRKSDAAIFHSYMTSWYRPDRSNPDTVRLYDGSNTLWTPESGYPSWGRALGSPDVVDDAMIEDGALKGRRLLVIANSSVTVTSRKAANAIRGWVAGGGTLIGFGEGCLSHIVEADRSLRPTGPLSGLISASKLDAAKSKSAMSVEARVGRGRVVLWLKPADPELREADGKRFVDKMMPVLRAEADRCGVRRWCDAGADYKANALYCGKDRNSGRHIFTIDLTDSAKNNAPDAVFLADQVRILSFDPSLKGEAELIGITNTFSGCEGGTAEYNKAAHTLIVRFKLPCKLTLRFGKS